MNWLMFPLGIYSILCLPDVSVYMIIDLGYSLGVTLYFNNLKIYNIHITISLN